MGVRERTVSPRQQISVPTEPIVSSVQEETVRTNQTSSTSSSKRRRIGERNGCFPDTVGTKVSDEFSNYTVRIRYAGVLTKQVSDLKQILSEKVKRLPQKENRSYYVEMMREMFPDLQTDLMELTE